jgi:RNA polymerase sigma-70 factor (ECF subfamily)
VRVGTLRPRGGRKLTVGNTDRLERSGGPSRSATTTLALLERARRGDREALDTLFAKLLPSLRRFAHGRLHRGARDVSDTADLVQQVMIGALRHLDRFEPRRRDALRAYLHQAIRNRVTDECRRKRRRPLQVATDGDDVAGGISPLTLLLSAEQEQRYQDALGRLRPDDRDLVVARLELGYSYAQISVATGRPSVDAARMAVRRALLRLAEEMGTA